MINISFDHAKIFTRQFPYTLPHPNLAQCESGWITLKNTKLLYHPADQLPVTDFAFEGYTSTSVRIIVINFVDNIMEGTFEGILLSNSGSRISVRNGNFRLRIKVVDLGK